MSINQFQSKTIPQLFNVVKNNHSIYNAITNYVGDDFKYKIKNNHPSDNLIKLGSVNNLDINLCVLKPHTFYYNKVPSYIKILNGATYIELDINQRINPGFMISNNMSLKLCNPHTLSNNNMGTNVLLTINERVNNNELPLL
tara:strand:- start:1533 stop:1958 length:426 start_codon:yes stop_codon:yes gene_type:complete